MNSSSYQVTLSLHIYWATDAAMLTKSDYPTSGSDFAIVVCQICLSNLRFGFCNRGLPDRCGRSVYPTSGSDLQSRAARSGAWRVRWKVYPTPGLDFAIAVCQICLSNFRFGLAIAVCQICLSSFRLGFCNRGLPDQFIKLQVWILQLRFHITYLYI